ncbi:O-antigen ligase family protein [Candidatus Steffania adelgidicola]|uniref:O-antigen ligase family protein n=1 Tax=Candidatus Steffania adelgidicola TaxID=1076626 RepID=UPI001D033EBF|nr:O-antigen ligase family protein [Candidatus Steffania adelgidicola]UDG80106.1 hypothetical protein GFK82_00667 [Candidatus Steffania adelgidicola]
MLFRISYYATKGFQVSFLFFIFFNAIFCGFTRVNNLFHFSSLCLLIMLVANPVLRSRLFEDWRFNRGLSIIALMLGYFSLTTLYPFNFQLFLSEIIHALYLLLFILMFRIMTLYGRRLSVLWAMASGMLTLVGLTFFSINLNTILSNRMQDGFFGAPSNVIDLAGYFSLGIFVFLIIIRETGIRWLYFPISLLLLALLLTQSRGPLLAFVASMVVLVFLQLIKREFHLLKFTLLGGGVVMLFYITRWGDIVFQRIANSYQQSFIRFGIWRYTLEMTSQKPFFGWGLEKQLSFTNLIGDKITTTHSLYFSALLKGGLFGLLLLMLVMIYGFFMVRKHISFNQELEGAIFLFTTGFYITQGMFIISNPGVSWNIFWFPVSVLLTLPSITSTDVIAADNIALE